MRRRSLVALVFAVLACAGALAHAAPDYSGKKLQKHDFRKAELAGAKFDEADLYGADFTGANLAGASFVGADLTQVKLDSADCTGANFTDAKFDTTMARETDFSKANLEGADVGGYTVVRGSNFSGANLRKLRGITETTECNFTGADLRGANLKNATDWKAPSAKWKKAIYDDATRFPKGIDPEVEGAIKASDAGPAAQAGAPAMTDAGPAAQPAAPSTGGGLGSGLRAGLGGGTAGGATDPAGAPGMGDAPAGWRPGKPVGTGKDASGQDWRGRDLKGEKLDDVNLSKATLIKTLFQEASLQRADLRGADLWGARLDGADLRGSDLREANLKDAHFDGTNLAGANLEGQDLSVLWGLSNSSFKGANLRGLKGGLHVTVTKCDFRKADVRGAWLAGPGTGYFSTCDFRGAVYDKDTRWPKGFDVAGAGAVLVGEPASADDEDLPPDRLLAADRDPDAPSEGVVKKTFRESLAGLAGELILEFGKGSKEGMAPPVSTAVRYSVRTTKLTYLPSTKFQPDPSSAAEMKGFPIDIEGELTAEGQDGSERTDPIHWTVTFYRTDGGIWKCVQPKAKHVDKTK